MATRGWQVAAGSTVLDPVVLAHNAPDLERWSKDVVERQVPFAAAAALTRMAQAAVKRLQATLGNYMTIRNQRVPRGITLVRAKKSDWPNPKAWVGDKDDFMRLQATGEPKRAKDGGMIAVPTRAILTKRGKAGTFPTAVRPVIRTNKADVGYRNPNVIRLNQNVLLRDLLWRRKGKLKNQKKASTIQALWSLRREQPMRKRWPFREEVQAECQANYASVFSIELEAAVRSAKTRATRLTSGAGRKAYLEELERVVRSRRGS